MTEPRRYLDWNATAPLRPEAVRAVAEAMACVGNPSSTHGFGRAARRLVEDARERVAALVRARAADVVFTGSGSEANNLALAGSGRTRLLVSAVEHDSVLAAASGAERLPVDACGLIRLDVLADRLAASSEPALVSVMLVNNETGVVQPVAAVAALAHAAGALVHCDAVQAAGRMPIDMAALGADLLTLSAHKLGGPAGIGALVLAGDRPLAAQVRGGGQERGRRAGTENLLGIAGFGAAAAAAAVDVADAARVERLRDRIEAALAPDARVHGAAAPRVGNTSCLGMPAVPAETQVMAFDLAGIAVSAGAACSSGKVRASHVLRAMGLDEAVAGEAIRVSLGRGSTEADVDAFVAVWRDLRRRTRGRAA